MSIVMLCGNGGTVPVVAVLHMVAASPSRTLLAASAAESSLTAQAVQPVRGSAGPIGGSPPSRPISAAAVLGPRPPASVRAVSRTYRAETALKTAVFRDLLSAQVPVTTGVPQFFPFMLTEIEYRPILPLDDWSCRGRYVSPETYLVACKLIVILCGRGAAGESLECQNVPFLPSIAFLAGWLLDWLLATAVQPDLESAAILGVNESAVVAVSIGPGLPAIVMGPRLPAWPAADFQEPDTNARPAMTTRAVTADVQNLFTKATPSRCRVTPLRELPEHGGVDSISLRILVVAKRPDPK